MFLTDRQISERGSKLILPFNNAHVQNICYDLSTESFCSEPNAETESTTLAPGGSVFVKTAEAVNLPDNMVGIVCLRNSRIRQGLDLSAPVYQPGHYTKIFFRLTNISQQSIRLGKDDEIASIMFSELSESVQAPYEGTFQSEFTFRGMGKYGPSLSKEVSEIEKKVDRVENIEKDIYGNVLAIMAIFVGIFSLINVNVTLAAQNVDIKMLLTMNLTTVSSISFLLAVINTMLPSGKYRKAVWIACISAFVLTLVVQFIL